MFIKRFFSPSGIAMGTGLGLVRMLTGVFMIYHGKEVFDAPAMMGYNERLSDLQFPAPALLAYLGKCTEFLGGILLTAGLFTRLAVLALTLTMLIIIFFMGKGNIFMDDQHPFLFVLLFLVFFFTGPGNWSVDRQLFGNRKPPSPDIGR